MLNLTLLLSVFRMIVLPVEFQDRSFEATPQQLEVSVRQAQEYFNRQYGSEDVSFQFDLASVTRLAHPLSYYGANYPDRKDIHLADAVREACTAQQGTVNFVPYDNDSDGSVDVVFLLTAGPGEDTGGGEDAIWPQQGRLSDNGGTLDIRGKAIDRFAFSPEGHIGIFCHEFGHILGLPDFYDTDGEGSGGNTPGLWGSSLMDSGCLEAVLPDFGAPEFDYLGLGRRDTLALGSYRLEPLLTGRRYLLAPTDKKDEHFLFACRDGGLWVWHIDRSDNPAGYAPRLEKDLTATERWEMGFVNDNPEHPCARLVPANPAAASLQAFPFPQAGFESFGSDTPSPFRSWSGRGTDLALTSIRSEADGSVSFEVIAPLTLDDLTLYQDAAVVGWKADASLQEIQGYELSWSDGTDEGHLSVGPDASCCTLEHLKPQTAYSLHISVLLPDDVRYSVSTRFVTKVYREGTYPYIYLNNVRRNTDGSFPAGTRIPLRVFNATQVEEVIWFLDGKRITPAADGSFTLNRSGVLSARILHTDGTSETIYKQITVVL
ncbi:MAG: M6 family metalloprotease domain-containing protein [Bacteroidales bacterium]|nr:M6 family metalloprotease domain-containing protein [Bacteroidales bacterium]